MARITRNAANNHPFHDGTKEAHERMNQRLAERRWAKQAAE